MYQELAKKVIQTAIDQHSDNTDSLINLLFENCDVEAIEWANVYLNDFSNILINTATEEIICNISSGNPEGFITLHQFYVNKISHQFDFDKIKSGCLDYPQINEDNDGLFGQFYLGSILYLTPSGKFYTPWANSNVTAFDAAKDEIWTEAMEEVFSTHDLYLTGGEGDGLDIFASRSIDWVELGMHRDLSVASIDDWEDAVREDLK